MSTRMNKKGIFPFKSHKGTSYLRYADTKITKLLYEGHEQEV